MFRSIASSLTHFDQSFPALSPRAGTPDAQRAASPQASFAERLGARTPTQRRAATSPYRLDGCDAPAAPASPAASGIGALIARARPARPPSPKLAARVYLPHKMPPTCIVIKRATPYELALERVRADFAASAARAVARAERRERARALQQLRSP